MHAGRRLWSGLVVLAMLAGVGGLAYVAGCGSGGNAWLAFGSPYGTSNTTGGTSGPSNTGQAGSIGGAQSDRAVLNPCSETQARKFVTVSMRNLSSDYVHYFFVAIAFVDVDQTDPNAIIPRFDNTPFPDGAVCPTDIQLYTQFGYVQIAAGEFVAFGDYCIDGPALYYFHLSGQFRRSAGVGNTGLGSAIAPAQGSSPTYDNVFSSAGRQIPAPDIIIFHNPGTGEGSQLKVSDSVGSPCDLLVVAGTPVCQRDAFYYVDESDRTTGTSALGAGSGRRVPSEIQGTGCSCTGLSRGYQALAPSGANARSAQCFEFLRGGRIDYAFVRDDQDPPFPQLVWKVADSSGSVAHEFDSRAGVP